MEENYIHIFCSYLADLMETKQFDFNDVGYIMTEFQPVCATIHSREELVKFIDNYVEDYPEFQKLKEQLLDEHFVFLEHA